MSPAELRRAIATILATTVPVSGCIFATSCPDTPSFFTQVVPLDSDDGGPRDAGPVGRMPSQDECVDLCRGAGGPVESCRVVTVSDAGMQRPAVECRVRALCEGRRPEGLREPAASAGDDVVGAYFARVAHLEAASVTAFARLKRELVAHGAPRRLVRAAERARRDEVRHARVTAAIARRYGAAPPRVSVDGTSARSLESIATENAVEGCVRETFGALVGQWQSRAARDPVVRAAMARIARDEAAHAALGWSVHCWIAPRLDRAARGRVETARRDAVESLVRELAVAPEEALVQAAGLPRAAHALALADAATRTFWS